MFNNRCPEKVCKASIKKSKEKLKIIYHKLKNKKPSDEDKQDVQTYGVEWTKIKGWEKGYYVYEECQINGPVDIIFMKFIDGKRIVYNIDSKGIHPNCNYFPQMKRKVSKEKFLERDTMYKRIQSIAWKVEEKNFVHEVIKNGKKITKNCNGSIVFKDKNNKLIELK